MTVSDVNIVGNNLEKWATEKTQAQIASDLRELVKLFKVANARSEKDSVAANKNLNEMGKHRQEEKAASKRIEDAIRESGEKNSGGILSEIGKLDLRKQAMDLAISAAKGVLVGFQSIMTPLADAYREGIDLQADSTGMAVKSQDAFNDAIYDLKILPENLGAAISRNVLATNKMSVASFTAIATSMHESFAEAGLTSAAGTKILSDMAESQRYQGTLSNKAGKEEISRFEKQFELLNRISQATGTSAEYAAEQIAAIEKSTESMRARANMTSDISKESYSKLISYMSQTNPALKSGFEEMMANKAFGMEASSEFFQRLQATNAPAAQLLLELVQSYKRGEVSDDAAFKIYGEISDKLSESTTVNRANLGAIIAQVDSGQNQVNDAANYAKIAKDQNEKIIKNTTPQKSMVATTDAKAAEIMGMYKNYGTFGTALLMKATGTENAVKGANKAVDAAYDLLSALGNGPGELISVGGAMIMDAAVMMKDSVYAMNNDKELSEEDQEIVSKGEDIYENPWYRFQGFNPEEYAKNATEQYTVTFKEIAAITADSQVTEGEREAAIKLREQTQKEHDMLDKKRNSLSASIERLEKAKRIHETKGTKMDSDLLAQLEKQKKDYEILQNTYIKNDEILRELVRLVRINEKGNKIAKDQVPVEGYVKKQ